jgi:hypothetical protein
LKNLPNFQTHKIEEKKKKKKKKKKTLVSVWEFGWLNLAKKLH